MYSMKKDKPSTAHTIVYYLVCVKNVATIVFKSLCIFMLINKRVYNHANVFTSKYFDNNIL